MVSQRNQVPQQHHLGDSSLYLYFANEQPNGSPDPKIKLKQRISLEFIKSTLEQKKNDIEERKRSILNRQNELYEISSQQRQQQSMI
jgi:hypothetical protein